MRPFAASAEKYAKAGLPVFRLAPSTNLPMKGSHSFNDATTDLDKIREWIEKTPAANVGLATGAASGIIALEDDPRNNGVEALRKLEEELGPLPETFEYTSPRGGTYRLYKIPEGAGYVKTSAVDGFDVKADGGYAAVPPSKRRDGAYRVSRRLPMSELPQQWIEWARTREQSPKTRAALRYPRQREPERVPAGRRVRSAHHHPQNTEGSQIPAGQRWITLRSIACRLHDGTRSEQRLYADLLAVPLEQPPGEPFTEMEVARLARDVSRMEPCSPGGKKGEAVPEVAEKVRAWERAFLRMFGSDFRGLGGQTDRDVLRNVIEGLAAHGRQREDDGVEFDMSQQDMGEAAGVCRQTASTAAKRLGGKIGLRVDSYNRKGEQASTWILYPPAQLLTSLPILLSSTYKRELESGVKSCAPPRVVGQPTPCFAHRGAVNKGEGGVLLLLRIHGVLTVEDLAAVMGARSRDIRRRYLNDRREKDGKHIKEGLISRGLVVERGGALTLPGDIDEREQAALNEEYSTLQTRLVRRKDPTTGMTVATAEETGTVASQIRREGLRRREYEQQRDLFRRNLALKREAAARRPEEDREIEAYLNSWDDERSESALGGTVVHDGYLVRNGEIVGEVHVPECECAPCEYARLANEREERT